MQKNPNSTQQLDFFLAVTALPREWKLLTGGLEKPHAWPSTGMSSCQKHCARL
jgi:hypothetical protein